MVAEALTSLITVGVGAYLLYNSLSLVFLGPLLLALIAVAVPILLGPRLTRSQRRALEATEKRLRSVSEIVEKSRSIRMGGIQEVAEKEIHENRLAEIQATALYRKILILVIFACKFEELINSVRSLPH